jgi:hypothetical protein
MGIRGIHNYRGKRPTAEIGGFLVIFFTCLPDESLIIMSDCNIVFSTSFLAKKQV